MSSNDGSPLASALTILQLKWARRCRNSSGIRRVAHGSPKMPLTSHVSVRHGRPRQQAPNCCHVCSRASRTCFDSHNNQLDELVLCRSPYVVVRDEISQSLLGTFHNKCTMPVFQPGGLAVQFTTCFQATPTGQPFVYIESILFVCSRRHFSLDICKRSVLRVSLRGETRRPI